MNMGIKYFIFIRGYIFIILCLLNNFLFYFFIMLKGNFLVRYEYFKVYVVSI